MNGEKSNPWSVEGNDDNDDNDYNVVVVYGLWNEDGGDDELLCTLEQCLREVMPSF